MEHQYGESARLYLLIVNPFFMVFGVIMAATGAWHTVHAPNGYMTAIATVPGVLPLIPMFSYAAFIIGGILILVGFIGYYGVTQINGHLLSVFMMSVMLLLLAECLAAIVIAVAQIQLAVNLHQNLHWNLHNHSILRKANTVTDGFNFVQSTFQCCGVDGPPDFNLTTSALPAHIGNVTHFEVPATCCSSEKFWLKRVIVQLFELCLYSSDAENLHMHREGCYGSVRDFFRDFNSWLITGHISTVMLILLQVAALISIRHFRQYIQRPI